MLLLLVPGVLMGASDSGATPDFGRGQLPIMGVGR